jgi:hypothetical protein
MTVQPYQQPQLERHTDSWTLVVEQVARLATQVANTELVPDALRGKPAAIAAVILYGREVGLPPMTALRTVYIVKGRVGVTAEAMRALVLAAGHDIEYRESSSARAVVAGRRRGTETWHVVTWTVDDARVAGLGSSADGNWRKYPRAMLKARACAELCRDLFPDVIGGFEATEEVDDTEPQAAPPTTTVRRHRRKATAVPPTAAGDLPGEGGAAVDGTDQSASAPELPSIPPAVRVPPALRTVDEVPLPEAPPPLSDDQVQEQALAAVQGTLGAVEVVEAPAAQHAGELPYSPEQRRMMMTLFAQLDISDRNERLKLSSAAVGRTITSANELTSDEASTIIDLLATAHSSPDPGAIIDACYAAAGYVADTPLDAAEAPDGMGTDR